jgi:hypothetical protein
MPTVNDTITAGYVQQFADTWELASQQTDSRLQVTTKDRGKITGSAFTSNNLGATAAQPVTSRLGDTVWTDIAHSTRLATMSDFDWSTPLDSFDVPKLLANPQGEYMMDGIAALNRQKDALIYSAWIGSAQEKTSEGGPYAPVVVPAGQKIVAGATGMTKAKLLAAKKLFRKNEADEHNGKQLFMLYNSEMLEDILADTTLTSADFMAVKMLQEGDVAGKWLGFKWIPYEGLLITGGTTYTTVAGCVGNVDFGMGLNRVIDVGPRRDKKMAVQIYAQESYGAVRKRETDVVLIDFV